MFVPILCLETAGFCKSPGSMKYVAEWMFWVIQLLLHFQCLEGFPQDIHLSMPDGMECMAHHSILQGEAR